MDRKKRPVTAQAEATISHTDRGDALPIAAILRRQGPIAAALAMLLCSVASAAADNSFVCEQQMKRAAHQNGIPLHILYSVGLTETGRRGVLSPYDMNVEGRAVHSRDLGEALTRLAAERARGAKLIDVGCMQINVYWHQSKFRSVNEMFEPARNVDYAAKLLKELKGQQGTWTLAVARYNAGPNNNVAQKRYVCAVINNMVTSGFGGWTPNARAFCDKRADAN
jgi:soluble lytic murein transglycosylase-like protein